MSSVFRTHRFDLLMTFFILDVNDFFRNKIFPKIGLYGIILR